MSRILQRITALLICLAVSSSLFSTHALSMEVIEGSSASIQSSEVSDLGVEKSLPVDADQSSGYEKQSEDLLSNEDSTTEENVEQEPEESTSVEASDHQNEEPSYTIGVPPDDRVEENPLIQIQSDPDEKTVAAMDARVWKA